MELWFDPVLVTQLFFHPILTQTCQSNTSVNIVPKNYLKSFKHLSPSSSFWLIQQLSLIVIRTKRTKIYYQQFSFFYPFQTFQHHYTCCLRLCSSSTTTIHLGLLVSNHLKKQRKTGKTMSKKQLKKIVFLNEKTRVWTKRKKVNKSRAKKKLKQMNGKWGIKKTKWRTWWAS